GGDNPQLRSKIAALATSADARVRFEALLIAGQFPAQVGSKVDEWESQALLVAAGRRGGDALAVVLHDPARLAASMKDPKKFVAGLARLPPPPPREPRRGAAR